MCLPGGGSALPQTTARSFTCSVLSAGEEGAGRCQDQAQLRPHHPPALQSSGETARTPRTSPRMAGSSRTETTALLHRPAAAPTLLVAASALSRECWRWEERHGDGSATCSKTQLAAAALEADLVPRTTQLLVDGHRKVGTGLGANHHVPGHAHPRGSPAAEEGIIPPNGSAQSRIWLSSGFRAWQRARAQPFPAQRAQRAATGAGSLPASWLQAEPCVRAACPALSAASAPLPALPTLSAPPHLPCSSPQGSGLTPGRVQPGFPAHTGAVPSGTRCPPVGMLPPTCCYLGLRLPAPSLQPPTPYVPTGVSSEPLQCTGAVLQQSPARWCPAAAQTPPAPQPFRSSPGGLFLHPHVPPRPPKLNPGSEGRAPLAGSPYLLAGSCGAGAGRAVGAVPRWGAQGKAGKGEAAAASESRHVQTLQGLISEG